MQPRQFWHRQSWWSESDFCLCRSSSMEKTRSYLEKIQNATGFRVDLFALEDVQNLQDSITQADLLVNATNVGMDGSSQPIPNQHRFTREALVASVFINPLKLHF